MSQKLRRLAQRRENVLLQVTAQRIALAQQVQPWRAPLALVDRGLSVYRYFKRYPSLWAGAALVASTIHTKRTGSWLARGWVVWHLGRSLLRR